MPPITHHPSGQSFSGIAAARATQPFTVLPGQNCVGRFAEAVVKTSPERRREAIQGSTNQRLNLLDGFHLKACSNASAFESDSMLKGTREMSASRPPPHKAPRNVGRLGRHT